MEVRLTNRMVEVLVAGLDHENDHLVINNYEVKYIAQRYYIKKNKEVLTCSQNIHDIQDILIKLLNTEEPQND